LCFDEVIVSMIDDFDLGTYLSSVTSLMDY
jgi:hypothetical protein